MTFDVDALCSEGAVYAVLGSGACFGWLPMPKVGIGMGIRTTLIPPQPDSKAIRISGIRK